jgi:hypothetical protein
LEIDKLYTQMGERTRDLSGTRTDGSAHNLMRAVSGIEMALWDLAGKVLDVPTSTLLGGKFRDKVRVYDHAAPRNMLDKASVADWAAKVKAHPSGFTCHKFGFPNSDPATDKARDLSNRVLTTRELINVQKGFENCREAIGWDRDLMVHCHWEYDLRTSIQIADAVEAVKPVWLGGSAAGRLLRFVEASVRGVQGADLHGREPRAPEGFKDFILNQGCDSPSSRPAEFGWVPRNQTHRRHGAHLRAADGESQYRQPGVYLRRGAVGGVDPRLHRARDHHRRRRVDGSGGAARRTVHQGWFHRRNRQTRARHRVEPGHRSSAPRPWRNLVGLATKPRSHEETIVLFFVLSRLRGDPAHCEGVERHRRTRRLS